MTLDCAKMILQSKYPSYRILNVRKFNNRYIFEMLPFNAVTDYDAFYAVDVKGNVSFFSPVFAKNPGDFLNKRPMAVYE